MPRWVWCFFLLATLAQAQGGYLTYPMGLSPKGVAAADLNGDGKPDLAIANAGSNSVTILLNDGKGGFTAQPPLVFGQSNPGLATLAPAVILTGDLNGDHKIDLVVLSETSVTLSPNTSSVGVVTLLGNGDGTFHPPIPVSGCANVAAQIVDWDGDGIPDLVGTCLVGGFLIPTGAALQILPGNGDGTFRSGAFAGLGFTPWAAPAIGDFNQDGKPDVAIAVGTALTVLLNDGKGGFTSVVNSNEPWNFSPGVAVGDFNGDGVPDVAVTGQSFSNGADGTVTVLLGKGDGTFKPGSSLSTVGFGQIVAADLNGDGHLDLVEADGPVFFAGLGNGTFERGLAFRGSADSDYVALADFTGSGKMGFAGTNDFYGPDGAPITGTVVILPLAIWSTPSLANASLAGYELGPLAPGSVAAAIGSNLAAQTAQATGALPTMLGGVGVTVMDSAGVSRAAQLYLVSPGQVNYVIPAASAAGLATVSISSGGNLTATGQIDIFPVAPSLFTVNPDNLAAVNVIRVSQSGAQTFETIYQTDANGNVTALPIDFGSATDTVYVALYGTGIRNYQHATSATIDGQFNAPVTYAGAQSTYPGLDQVNIQLPSSLASLKGSTTAYTILVQLNVDGQASNPVTLLVQ
jgi:uncharacterized protein (TIGR03437 family)